MLSNKKVKKDNTQEEKKSAEKLKEAISKAEEEKASEPQTAETKETEMVF